MPPPVLPVLLLSKLTRGVNGRPDCAVRMPLTCQCRSSAGALSATGTFHVAEATSRCRTSKSDGPHSAAKSRLFCGVLSSPSVARNDDVSSSDVDQV